MSKQKVRPMVDKELRDEVVGYLGGASSFNEALRWYVKGYKRLTTKNKGQSELLSQLESELMFTKLELQANKSHSMTLMAKNQEIKNQLKLDAQELNELKKANAELSTTLEGTKKACDSIFELYMNKKGARPTYLIFGLVAGLVIQYLFL